MSRASNPGGRFDLPYEAHEIARGLDADVRSVVGGTVLWVRFDPEHTIADDIYGVSSNIDGEGRAWVFPPIRIAAFATIIMQGASSQNERGFYNSDTLHLSISSDVLEEVFPELPFEPDQHLKDRILFRGHVYVPTTIGLRGILRNQYTIVSIDANQVNPEEYVNDPVLTAWVNRGDDVYPMPYAPQLQRRRST